MPTLTPLYEWFKDQVVIVFLFWLLITVIGIVSKKAWFTGIWSVCGFVIFGMFLYNEGIIEGLAHQVSDLLGMRGK